MRKVYKILDHKETFDKGYIQEANRRFFHLVGLNLVRCIIDENPCLLIEDFRDNNIYFDFYHMSKDEIKEANKRKDFIDKEINGFKFVRRNEFGNSIEPIPEIKNE